MAILIDAKEFEKSYYDFISNRNHYPKLKDSDIILIANKMFRRIYSNFEQEGAKRIFQIYSLSFMSLCETKDPKNKALINELINLALEINPLDVDCLWYRFMYDIDCIFQPKSYAIASRLSSSNFTPFDVNMENVDAKLRKGNLYYFMLKAIQSGYKMNFKNDKKDNTNYFNTILNAACLMFSKSNNRKLVKQIFQFMASLIGSGSPDDQTSITLFMTIGNRLLIGKDFKEARRYYQEVLAIDEDNCDARWGITKCDIMCPTNYSVLFYKQSLNDVSSFRTLIAVRESKHANEVDIYLPFYQAIENIKNERGSRRKKLYKAFAFKNDELLRKSFPVDTPLDELITSVGNNTIISSMETAKRKSVSSTGSRVSSPTYTSSSSGSGVGFIVSMIVLLTAAFTIPFIFKAETAFLLLFLMTFIYAIVIRNVSGNYYFRKSPLVKVLYIMTNWVYLVDAIVVFFVSPVGSMAFTNTSAAQSTMYIVFLVFGLIAITLMTVIGFVKKTKRNVTIITNAKGFTFHMLSNVVAIFACFTMARIAFLAVVYGTFFGADIASGLSGFLSSLFCILMVAFPFLVKIPLKLARG